MKAVFLDFNSLNQNDLEISRLQQQFDQLILHAVTAPDEILERVQNADVIITNKVRVNAELIRQLPKLKLILISATGTNNVDLSAAREHNIVVCNCQGYGTPAVAQHTLLLMLSLATSFLKYDRAVRTGAWNKAEQFCLLDFPIVELAGKTLGIVGYGELGQAVARLAEAFGMQVKIASLPCRPGGTDRIPLKELLPQVDFLSLHCPLTEQTQNLIGAAELQQMKPTAFLINCARGGLVNETALVQALKNGEIAGAASDVLTVEPPKQGNILLNEDIPNLIVTPHSAWGSVQARQRMLEQLAENTEAFKRGLPIRQVN